MDYDDGLQSYKVVIVGESGVGKTSIISYYINEAFDISTSSTVSVTYVSKEINCNGRNIKFEIWDTAGQEKFRSLTRIFYKNSNVAFLVYDITNRSTFEEIKNYWYKQIQDNCPEINKSNFN